MISLSKRISHQKLGHLRIPSYCGCARQLHLRFVLEESSMLYFYFFKELYSRIKTDIVKCIKTNCMHCVHVGGSLFPTGFSFSGCGAWSQNVSMMLGSKPAFSIETTQKHLRAQKILKNLRSRNKRQNVNNFLVRARISL